MLSRLKYLVLSSLVLMLSGCAFVSESVPLQPQITVPATHIGDGKTVAVKVIDARPDDTIGGRASGYGPAAKIKLASNITDTVRTAVYEGMRRNGFQPISYDENVQRKLIVRIIALQYKQRTGLFVGTITISSTLEASADNKGKTYEKIYRTENEHNIVVTPTSGSDEKNINEALSSSLNKLLGDEQLMRFLAK